MGANMNYNGSLIKAIVTLARRILLLPRLLKDPSVKIHKKVMIMGGILYLISPIDLLADPILAFGLIDDTVLMVYIISKIKDELDKYNGKDNNIVLEKDKIIEKVDYKIDDKI